MLGVRCGRVLLIMDVWAHTGAGAWGRVYEVSC